MNIEKQNAFQLAKVPDKHVFYFPASSVDMQNIKEAELNLGEGGVKIGRGIIKNLRYAEDTILLAATAT